MSSSPRVARLPAVAFLVFGDAITGIIGIMLVVLVLARPPAEQPVQLEQTDLRLRCPGAMQDLGQARHPLLIVAQDGTPVALEALLADSYKLGAVSIRLVVERTALDDHDEGTCLYLLREAIDANNSVYERPGMKGTSIKTPYLFLTTILSLENGGD